MDKNIIETRVREFIEKVVKKEIDPNEPIISSGLLNSLFAMQILLFIEKEFKFKVANEDLSPANFDSIAAISDFVGRKTEIEESI